MASADQPQASSSAALDVSSSPQPRTESGHRHELENQLERLRIRQEQIKERRAQLLPRLRGVTHSATASQEVTISPSNSTSTHRGFALEVRLHGSITSLVVSFPILSDNTLAPGNAESRELYNADETEFIALGDELGSIAAEREEILTQMTMGDAQEDRSSE